MLRFFTINGLKKGIRKKAPLPEEKEIYAGFVKLAWPAALEGLLIILFSMVDLIMVGSLGTDAVAAVGIIGQPRMLILCFCRSLAVGVTAVVARRKGEGRTQEIDRCLKQGLDISLIISVVFLAVSLVLIEQLVLLAGANDEYLDMAVSYGRYVMIGVFFTAVATVINAALTGIGRTKVVMWTNIVGNIVNAVLNFFLIYGIGPAPELGIAGAGIATMIGNIVSFGISLYFVTFSKNKDISIMGSDGWRPRPPMMRLLGRISVSAFAEQFFERVGMFLYSRIVAELGTVEFATYHICMEMCDLQYSFAQGFSKASSALTGQRLGEGRSDLAYISAKAGRRIGLISDVFFFAFYILGRKLLMSLFSSDQEVIALGSNIMILVAVGCFVVTSGMVYAGALRGAGDTAYVAKYSFWDIAVCRPVITYLLCISCGLGVYGAFIAVLLDQSARAVFSGRRFRGGRWMEIKI